MAFDTSPGVQYEETRWRQHKQGRFVQVVSGYLMRPSGDNIDLHAMLTDHKPSVNLYPIHSNEMRVSGLFRGSYAVVDSNGTFAPGKVVVVRYNSQVVIRKLMRKDRRWCLVADDPREQILYCDCGAEIERLGVVTHSIIEMTAQK